MVKRAVGLLLASTGVACAAWADTRPGNPLIDALARCQTMVADVERLACMDAAAAKLVAAEKGKDVVVVTRDEVRTTKRALFGLAIDQNAVFGDREAPADRVDRLDTTLAAATATGDRWTLSLAEGGRWRTTEPWINADPKPGMAVEVHRGALGSFVLRAKGATAVRVARVN